MDLLESFVLYSVVHRRHLALPDEMKLCYVKVFSLKIHGLAINRNFLIKLGNSIGPLYYSTSCLIALYVGVILFMANLSTKQVALGQKTSKISSNKHHDKNILMALN